MANQIITVQLSLPSGVKSPVVTSDKRVTAVNLAKVLRQGLVGGNLGGLSGAGAYFQVQTSVVAATGTATCAAVAVNDTVTIGGQALTAKQKRATGTATAATVLADTTLTIAGVVFTAVDGAVVLGEATFDCSGTDTECATSIAAQVNAYVPLQRTVFAKSASAVVTFVAYNQGTSGNSISLASSDGTTLAVSAATLENGAALANNEFDCAGTNDTTAAALAAAVLASTTAAVQRVTAAAASAVVTFTAKEAGDAGEAIALASSNGTRLAVSGAALANGSSSAVTRWTF